MVKEPKPDYPCPGNHKGEWHWWQRKDGGWVCSRCHPPVEDDIKEWEKRKENQQHEKV
jgi:Zn-finger protein